MFASSILRRSARNCAGRWPSCRLSSSSIRPSSGQSVAEVDQRRVPASTFDLLDEPQVVVALGPGRISSTNGQTRAATRPLGSEKRPLRCNSAMSSTRLAWIVAAGRPGPPPRRPPGSRSGSERPRHS
jgi:hypothetical protein